MRLFFAVSQSAVAHDNRTLEPALQACMLTGSLAVISFTLGPTLPMEIPTCQSTVGPRAL